MSGQRLRTHGEETFLVFIECVRLEAAQAFEDGAPGVEFGRGNERGEFFLGNSHQLGADVGAFFHDIGVEVLQTRFALEEGRVGSVLTDAQAGVGAEALEGLVDAFFEFEGGEEGRGRFG